MCSFICTFVLADQDIRELEESSPAPMAEDSRFWEIGRQSLSSFSHLPGGFIALCLIGNLLIMQKMKRKHFLMFRYFDLRVNQISREDESRKPGKQTWYSFCLFMSFWGGHLSNLTSLWETGFATRKSAVFSLVQSGKRKNDQSRVSTSLRLLAENRVDDSGPILIRRSSFV